MNYKKNILITGGAGFIGSHLVTLFVTKYPHYRIINVDKLTYAGNLANLKAVENAPNYVFEKADICDFPLMQSLFKQYEVSHVIHLAAESHVDRSIKDPFTFAQTNVMGTLATTHTRPIRPAKPPATTLCARFTIHTACPLPLAIAQTTTAHFSFPRN